MSMGPGRFLAVGLGAHAAGRAAGNAAIGRYVEQVHHLVRQDVQTLYNNLPLPVLPMPPQPPICRQPSVLTCVVRSWFLTGMLVWVLSLAGCSAMAHQSPQTAGEPWSSILAAAALIAVVPALLVSLLVGLPAGLGVYASRARAYSRFEGGTLVQRYHLERERIRRGLAADKISAVEAAALLSRWPQGVDTYRVIA